MKRFIAMTLCVCLMGATGCSFLPRPAESETEASYSDFTTATTTTETTAETTPEETEETDPTFGTVDIKVNTVGDLRGDVVNKVYFSPYGGVRYVYPEHASSGNRDAAQDLFNDVQKIKDDMPLSEVSSDRPIVGAYVIWVDNSLMEISYLVRPNLTDSEYKSLLQDTHDTAVESLKLIGHTISKSEVGKVNIDGVEFDSVYVACADGVARQYVVRYSNGVLTYASLLTFGGIGIDKMLEGLHLEK